MNEESLVDKYRPTTLDDVVGNDKKIKRIRKWADGWDRGDNPLLLYGKPGVGKTSTAEALANDMEWSFIEINASDARRTDDIKAIAQEMRSGTYNAERQLFLLDEVDSYKGSVSLSPLLKVLDNAPNPVIMTCNEKWKVPDSIVNKSKDMKFSLKKNDKKQLVNKIATIEGIDISNRKIGMLATRDGLRDAINDLQEYALGNGELDWDQRNTDIGAFNAVDNIIKGKKYTGEMTPPDMVDWFDENISSRFEGVEAMRAYQALAEADKWLEQTNRTQNYSWWKYVGSIAEEVANVRLSEPYDGFIRKSYPKSRRNYTPRATSDNATAQLYQELKKFDLPEHRYNFNFNEFRNEILPILRDLDSEKKYQFILEESLSPEAYRELDVSRGEFESWLGSTEEFEDDVEKDEEGSILDF